MKMLSQLIHVIKAKKIKANNTGFIINRKPLGILLHLQKYCFFQMSEDV